MNFLDTMKGSLLENFFPAGWDLGKIDRCCSQPPEAITSCQPYWNPGFQPVACDALSDFDMMMGHEIALQIRKARDEGKQLGVMTVRDALAVAIERDLDLVEVSPTAVPPVCKILDFGKYKYQMNKKHGPPRLANCANWPGHAGSKICSTVPSRLSPNPVCAMSWPSAV